MLIRDLPRFAPGMPAMLTVGLYMLLGGTALLTLAILGRTDVLSAAPWPQSGGLLLIAGIGILLGALEAFFVVGGNNKMPLPDALIVYNITSFVLIAAASILLFKEPITVLAIVCDLLAWHLRRETLAQVAKLRDPDVKKRWIEHDQPQCLAYQSAIRIGTGCFGLFGVAIVSLAVFN